VNPPDDSQDLQVDEPVGFLRRCGYLFGPVMLTAAIAGVIFLVYGFRTMNHALVAAGVSLFGAGTTVVFGEAALGDKVFDLQLNTWALAYIVMYVNAVSAYFYAYNLDLLQKVPKIGPYMRRARMNSVAMLRQRPWIRRWAVVGVGLFVLTPLPGSGALGGALMGRIVGVSKRATTISVAVAGVIVAGAYAMLANELKQALDKLEQFAPSWVRFAVFILGAIVMIWIMTKLVRWFASHPVEEEGPASEGA
jgi:uncharacterized membrane protein